LRRKPSSAMDKIQKNLSDIERKLTKSNALAAKGENMKLGDTIKLARKSNSIISTVKKGIKEYKVGIHSHNTNRPR